jgi:hypothetical protein
MRIANRTRNLRRLIIVCVALCACAALPLLSSARSSSSTNIVNNSSRRIVHLYLSHVNADDWSGDQLGGAIIDHGQSFNFSNYACDQQQIRLIGEDQDGCFLSTTVACGSSDIWTITNDTVADCGQ